MTFNNIFCTDCGKKKVCRFIENKKEVEGVIKDKVIPCAKAEAPFKVSLYCDEYIKEQPTKRGGF